MKLRSYINQFGESMSNLPVEVISKREIKVLGRFTYTREDVMVRIASSASPEDLVEIRKHMFFRELLRMMDEFEEPPAEPNPNEKVVMPSVRPSTELPLRMSTTSAVPGDHRAGIKRVKRADYLLPEAGKIWISILARYISLVSFVSALALFAGAVIRPSKWDIFWCLSLILVSVGFWNVADKEMDRHRKQKRQEDEDRC